MSPPSRANLSVNGSARPLHLLVLTDRDWTHPQGGGTGVSLLGYVRHWLEQGHRVTVIAGSYPGAVADEHQGRLTVHRRGTRLTVFPHAAIGVRLRGLGSGADAVIEIVNGISFLAPLWTRLPHVAWVHHVHRRQYLLELGLLGRVAAFWLETVPLRSLYRRRPFFTVSVATARELAELGVAAQDITIRPHAPDPAGYGPGARTPDPTLLYLGRLKRYKRVELLLDMLVDVPAATLDIAGDGDHREAVDQAIADRGLEGRVRVHGHVDEASKVELLRRAWLLVTASGVEGLGLNVLEAAACGTPAVALAVGGLTETIVHGETGLLAHDVPELTRHVARLLDEHELRERLGREGLRRAQERGWDAPAAAVIELLRRDPGASEPAEPDLVGSLLSLGESVPARAVDTAKQA